jgi:uncharacterized protein YcbK (DUF882 family)
VHPECSITVVSMDLVEGLEGMRALLLKHWDDASEFPGLRVLSGYRCKRHNTDIGGKPDSKHLLGIAADVTTRVTPKWLAASAKTVSQFKNGGIGLYSWGIHVDCRGIRARW